jgi:hypothetical protein
LSLSKQQIKIHKLKYFKEVWNILDVCILLICYICIIFNIYRTIKVNTLLDGLLKDSTQFVDFSDLAYAQNMFNQAIAITAFLSWVKFFKYISFNRTMSQLSSTLGRCAKDIVGFMVMFAIIFGAYTQLGFLLFGSTINDYSSVINTGYLIF